VAEVVISRRAALDLRLIWHHISEDNERAADSLLAAIEKKIERLGKFPKFGVRRDDIRRNAHMLTHGVYLILYEFSPSRDVVEIVAVVHGMRDLGRLF
jgi:toxin ParE1/3/4